MHEPPTEASCFQPKSVKALMVQLLMPAGRSLRFLSVNVVATVAPGVTLPKFAVCGDILKSGGLA
jgi:hypothetical protein